MINKYDKLNLSIIITEELKIMIIVIEVYVKKMAALFNYTFDIVYIFLLLQTLKIKFKSDVLRSKQQWVYLGSLDYTVFCYNSEKKS